MFSKLKMTLLLAVLFLTGCQKREAFEQPPVLVAVHRVSDDQLLPAQRYTGQIRSRYEITSSFRVAGKIAQRLADVGQAVRAGDVLARLDATDYQLTVEAATNELESALASELRAVQEEGRTRDLSKRKMISDSEYDAAKSAADSASAAVRRAKRMLELAQHRLEYCVLKAEHDSVVTAVLAESGGVVLDGTPIFQLARLDEREVVIDIPENRIEQAKEQTGSLTLWSNSNAPIPIKLREIAPSADPATRTYRARYSIPNASEEIRLGMTAIVELSSTTQAPLISVPMTSLVHRQGETAVWRVDVECGKLSLQPVIVQSYGDKIAWLNSGLSPNDCIVRAGVQKLDESTRIQVWNGNL